MQLPNYPKPFSQTAERRKKPINVRKNFFELIQLLSEIKEQMKDMNDIDKSQFFYVNARLIEFKTDQDKMFYLACPNTECKRKVT